MRNLFFTLLIFVFTNTFAQTTNFPSVEYFGGIYENTAYFNWVFHNRDTCEFVLELSYDGDNYQVVDIKDSIVKPMPVAVLHGYKVTTCEKELWFRVIAKTEGKVFVFLPEPLCENKYTFEPTVYAPHPVHGNF